MFLDEITNAWSPHLYSLLHSLNYTFILPKLHYDGTNHDNNTDDGIAFFGIFAIWSILYYAYKNLLNLMLRRLQFPLIKRNRIIDALWCCGFAACSIVFLLYFVPEHPERNCPWHRTGNYRLGFLMHKAFYIHRASVEVFIQQRWLNGWTSQLFASSIPFPSHQKWPKALTTLLFYKASDSALLNICRLALSLTKTKIIKRLVKIVFLVRFFNRIYVHILIVPGSLAFNNDGNQDWKRQASLWIWLASELLNSIRNNEFRCLYSSESLETSLFPPSSQESIEFVNIIKKRRCANNEARFVDEGSTRKQKKELWQTLFCAMTMKKKLKKLRKAKESLEHESSD